MRAKKFQLQADVFMTHLRRQKKFISQPRVHRDRRRKVIKLHKTIYFCQSYISLQVAPFLIIYKITELEHHRLLLILRFTRNPLSTNLVSNESFAQAAAKNYTKPEFPSPITFYLLLSTSSPSRRSRRPIVLNNFLCAENRVHRRNKKRLI